MAHIRRHPVSGRWQVRYRDPDSRERSRTFTRKVDADRFAATVTRTWFVAITSTRGRGK